MYYCGLFSEIAGLEGQATSEGVESKFSLARCIRQGSVEALPALAEHGHGDPLELGTSMGKDENGCHVGSWWTNTNKYAVFCVGRQLLGHVSLKGPPGTDDERSD